MPPGHPIILLKSNEFNMATVSVKRSIEKTPNSTHTMTIANQRQFPLHQETPRIRRYLSRFCRGRAGWNTYHYAGEMS